MHAGRRVTTELQEQVGQASRSRRVMTRLRSGSGRQAPGRCTKRKGGRKETTHSPVSPRPAQPRVPCPRRSARPRSPTRPGSAAAGRVAPGSRRREQLPKCCAPAKEQGRRTLLPGPAPRPTPPREPRPQPGPPIRYPRSVRGTPRPLCSPGSVPPLALLVMTLLDSQLFLVPSSLARLLGPDHPHLVPGGSPSPPHTPLAGSGRERDSHAPALPPG